MITTIGDFFISSNAVRGITDLDYERADILVHAAKAFARSTNQAVYVIDYNTQGFLYVSNNLANWCGYDAERIKDFGYQLYLDCVPVEEQEMLLEINSKGFELFETFPVDERYDVTISYDFHLIKKNNVDRSKPKLVHHTLTPMALTKEGRIWLALCTVSIASATTPGHIIMKRDGAEGFFEYNLQRHCWEKKDCVTLSETEKTVLILSAQGYTIKDIANIICKSDDTVKSYRRVLFEKLGVNNNIEALTHSINYKLL